MNIFDLQAAESRAEDKFTKNNQELAAQGKPTKTYDEFDITARDKYHCIVANVSPADAFNKVATAAKQLLGMDAPEIAPTNPNVKAFCYDSGSQMSPGGRK